MQSYYSTITFFSVLYGAYAEERESRDAKAVFSYFGWKNAQVYKKSCETHETNFCEIWSYFILLYWNDGQSDIILKNKQKAILWCDDC